MNKAIKYRLYPTKEQALLFIKTFGCCRKVYNLMLEDKIAHYEATGEMLKTTPAQYKSDYPFLKEVDSLALANVQLNLQSAFSGFFKGNTGFPKYKSAKRSRRTYTTNNQNGTVALADKHIRLPKAGMVKAVIHRKPETDWKLKSATVSQESDGKFYASVLFEFDKTVEPAPKSDNAVGLDYKSDGLFVDSNGRIGSNHKYYRESQVKLAKAQRKLKHKTIGSNNYIKQQLKIAKIYKQAANRRLDNLHKLSTEIANQYDIVCVEDLNMRALSNKGFGNGKATMDNGYGLFLNLLEYKLADRGKYFVKVGKLYPSSQTCSRCGALHPEMKVSKYHCKEYLDCECGAHIQRDYNAAINIRNEGLRVLG